MVTVKKLEMFFYSKTLRPQQKFALTRKAAIPQLCYLNCPRKVNILQVIRHMETDLYDALSSSKLATDQKFSFSQPRRDQFSVNEPQQKSTSLFLGNNSHPDFILVLFPTTLLPTFPHVPLAFLFKQLFPSCSQISKPVSLNSQ